MNVFVPTRGPESWRELLADPDKQWARGYSARTLAHCWVAQPGFPPEVRRALQQSAATADAEALFVFPEWKVSLPGGGRPSQNDVWVLARNSSGLISVAVEGKVDEPFDKTVNDWLANASEGKEERLAFLENVLGLAKRPAQVRYQLLHRAASAVLEAERVGAVAAVMLVHSFSPQNRWFEDFAAFASLFGVAAQVGQLHAARARGGMPLLLGWVHGNERFLGS